MFCFVFGFKRKLPYTSFSNAGLWETLPPSPPASTGVHSPRPQGRWRWPCDLPFASGMFTDKKAEAYEELAVWLGLLYSSLSLRDHGSGAVGLKRMRDTESCPEPS